MPQSLNFTTTAVTLASSVAQLVVGIGSLRSYLFVQNTGVGSLSVGFSSAPTAGRGVSLDAASGAGGQGGSWELTRAVPSNSVWLYSAAGTTAVVVQG